MLVPQLPGGTSSVSTTRSSDGLSSYLRMGMKSTQERSGPLACLREEGCHLPINVSVDKEIQIRSAKFWPVILFFSLSHLHSLMQDTFNASFFVENWGLGE